MKPTELMIGDWVKWKDKYVQIATISGIVYSFGHIDVEIAHCGSGLIERHDLKSISPIPLTLEILERIGFYWGYTSSEEDSINNMPTDIPVSMPDKHWCYDNENGGEITIELPNESDGGHITVGNNDRWIEFFFDKPISLHELQQMLRVCGLNELADNLKLEE